MFWKGGKVERWNVLERLSPSELIHISKEDGRVRGNHPACLPNVVAAVGVVSCYHNRSHLPLLSKQSASSQWLTKA
jgi:hypothetical protein